LDIRTVAAKAAPVLLDTFRDPIPVALFIWGLFVTQFPIRGTYSWRPDKASSSSNPLQDSFIQLDQAEQLRQQGKLERAQRICESLVRQYPDYMGALHTLGLIYADRENYQRAFDCLARAVMLNPRSWTTLTALSGVYLRLDAPEMAAQTLEQAKLIKPLDASVLVTLGEIYREEREYELAQDAFRQAVALDPKLAPAVFGLGTCCSFLGQYAEAAEVFERFVKGGLRFLDLLLGLASLPPAVVSIDVLGELDRVVREPKQTQAEFENFAAFVRAAVLDKAGRYGEAWEQLVPANRTLFRAMQQDLQVREQRQQAVLASLRGAPIKVYGDGGGKGKHAISLFILGSSRSGKTTMEQLVATLDGVKRGYENPIVENAVRRTFQGAALLTGDAFPLLPQQLDAQCREIYLEELARRAGSARVFTNAHPARIDDAARIVAAFPNVRFICMKRNLEDITLRIYMRKYARGNAYSYDLRAIRAYVTWYHQVMDMLADKLPDIVRVVHYEDMVADPAAALRVAAELCGLGMPQGPLPAIGDDRGCAEPYRQLMAAELGHRE
jgi:tetratricopeptide (TPR) repeat protein